MMARRIALLWLVISTTACTTVMYEGNTRPDSDVATITSQGTRVMKIDGVNVPYSGGVYAKFKILPGEHSVTLALNDGNRISAKHLTISFLAEAGQTYVTKPTYSGSLWAPDIYEASTNQVVTLRKLSNQ